MSKEPENLILKLLREMRGDMTALRARADEHGADLKALRKEIRDGQVTTATATGFAMHANLRGQSLEEEIADLKRRVEILENAP
jgi:polyhydroxyalkanoate synthesis regulator phasin